MDNVFQEKKNFVENNLAPLLKTIDSSASGVFYIVEEAVSEDGSTSIASEKVIVEWTGHDGQLIDRKTVNVRHESKQQIAVDVLKLFK